MLLQNRNKSVKIDYGNFKLDLSRKFFYSQAVLSVTGCIRCIVFKWVENTNSNGTGKKQCVPHHVKIVLTL